MTARRRGTLVVAPRRHQVIRLAGLLVTTVALGGCSDPSAPGDVEPDPALGPRPVLWNLGVDFDAAFNLDEVETTTYKFLEFGFEVLDSESGEAKPLPHFTYTLSRSIEIISPMEGVVAGVHLQDALTQDFAISLKPRGDPTLWVVEFDHVTQVAVAEGDEVDVGDHLGYPLWSVELMVNAPHAHVCPFQVFAPAAATELQGKLAEFMAAWDAAKWALPEDNPHHPGHASGWYTPYAEVEMIVPGCRTLEIPYAMP